jgi:hypothetical protein
VANQLSLIEHEPNHAFTKRGLQKTPTPEFFIQLPPKYNIEELQDLLLVT